MPITQRNKIGMLEAMLFANAEPVETDRLAEAMRADPAEVLTLLEKLQKRYDETESGLMLLHFDGDRWQMATRPYYGEVVKRIWIPAATRRFRPLRWKFWLLSPITSRSAAASSSRCAA